MTKRNPRITTAKFMALLLCAFVCLGSVALAETPDSPDARLLQAEILEVSRGDLEGAMQIYRELIGGEDTGASIRARALLRLASCHRKRGELEAARSLLEELVEKHSAQKNVIDQARDFLREIQAGRSDNPAFDWLEDLLSSPEIQARIFEHIMAMVTADEAGQSAKSQLKALGGIVVPAVKKVVETTQDPTHRDNLARLLVELGHTDYLTTVLATKVDNAVLDWADQQRQWLRHGAGESEKAKWRESLARCSPDSYSRNKALAALRLAAEDYTKLQDDFRTLASYIRLNQSQTYARFADVLGDVLHDERSHSFLAAMQFGEKQQSALVVFVRTLIWEHPELTSPEQLTTIAEHYSDDVEVGSITRHLGEKRDFETLGLFSKDWEGIHGSLEDIEGWTKVDSARYYAAIDNMSALHGLAEESDEAIDIFVRRLRERASETEASEYLGKFTWTGLRRPRTTRATRATRATRNNSRPRRSVSSSRVISGVQSTSPISPAYAMAMAPLLNSDDAASRFIAIEALGRADRDVGPDVMAPLTEIVRSEGDWLLRTAAVGAIMRRISRGWQSEEAVRTIEPLFDPNKADSFLQRMIEDLPPSAHSGLETVALGNPSSSLQADSSLIPYIQTLVGRSDERAATSLRYYVSLFPQDLGVTLAGKTLRWSNVPNPPKHEFIRAIETLPSVVGRRAAVRIMNSAKLRPLIDLDPKTWQSIFSDRELGPGERRNMLSPIGQSNQLECVDWEALLASDDPFVPEALRLSNHALRGSPKLRQYLKLAFANPLTRGWAISAVPEDDPLYALELRRALESDDPELFYEAVTRTGFGRTTKTLPLLFIVLERGDFDEKMNAIEKISQLPDASSYPGLTKLLDAENIALRAAALDALEKIRSTLEKQEEWKQGAKGNL